MVSGANGRQRERLLHGLGSVLVVLYALFPVAWIVSLSLKRSADLDDRRFVPQSFSMEHYQSVINDPQFPDSAARSACCV